MVFATLVFVLFCILDLYIIQASMISTQPELCGHETEVTLGLNAESSTVVTLNSREDTPDVCKIRISAPPGHVVFVRIVDQPYRANFVKYSADAPSCTLSVFQNDDEKTAVWAGDLCSTEHIADVDLLKPRVTLRWRPPEDPTQILGRSLLITAVGQGEICNSENYHTCMSIGHEPLFCVSNYLVCDTHQNCPQGATKSDENKKICKSPYLLTVDWFKTVKNPTEYLLKTKFLNSLLPKTTTEPTKGKQWKNWKNVKEETTTTQQPESTDQKSVSAIESFSIALSHYGPWGYIMLGILICGTVMMFCGVWECVRKAKPNSDASQTSSTTVLIINNQQEENQPPRYDDLDPPSYTTLFPNIKPDNPAAIATETPQEQTNENCDNQNESAAGTEQAVENTSTQVDIVENNPSVVVET